MRNFLFQKALILKNWRSFTLVFGLSLGIVFGSLLLFNKKKPGFALNKVRSPFQYSPKWQIEDLSGRDKEKVHEILSQDFNYLGSGAQCYAFISADGKYVLKFFKMKHFIPKKWLKLIPLPGLEPYRFRKLDRRILNQEKLFSSYKMAYEKLKEATGLVYIHLNKSKDLDIKVRLYDRMRKCCLVNLDKYEFVLQEKAQLVRDRITALMQKGDNKGAIEAIRALLQEVIAQCQKGVIDSDSGISNNYGFIDQRVIHFDVGRIMYDEVAKEPAHYQREVLRVSKKLESWIAIHYPMLLPSLDEQIDSLISPSS